MTKGNPDEPTVTRVQNREEALSGLDRVRRAARGDARLRFTSLMHHVTVDMLRDSYLSLNPRAVPGVDEVTWRSYGEDVENRLTGLHERVQSGRYRAKPSKRAWIPKADGRERPIGIAALEDKIVQRAIVWVLEQVYEEDFTGFSYGFRPGRSPHGALDALWVEIMQRKVSWVWDADIRNFFDAMDHGWMMKFMGHRVADPRVLRLIRKWLRAGVSEDGEWSKTTVGTPQGAVISPFLANVYLHYVLDLWVEWWRKNRARGEVMIVRYADDFVMGFQYREDGERFASEATERFTKFGLELNREKTRLIEFGRFAAANRAKRGEGKPETFDFLGFTHLCGKTRKNGRFMVQRRPVTKRMREKVKEIRKKIMRHRHLPVPQQGKWLRSVVQGYFNYFAVPGSTFDMGSFRTLVNRAWYDALRQRSHKARNLGWKRMTQLLHTWIPPVKIVHPYPNVRLCVS